MHDVFSLAVVVAIAGSCVVIIVNDVLIHRTILLFMLQVKLLWRLIVCVTDSVQTWVI